MSHFTELRISSLRNLEYSATYMHVRRFSNLLEFIEHYNSVVTLINRSSFNGVSPSLLDSNGNPTKLELTDEEKLALHVFLITLTDRRYVVVSRTK